MNRPNVNGTPSAPKSSLAESIDIGQPPPAEAPINANRFDPKNLVLTQNFDAEVGVVRLITVIPVRKPGPQEWVRVRNDPAFHLQTLAFISKIDREEIYLVDRAVAPSLVGETKPIALYTTINRNGVLSLWPVKLAGADGRTNDWSESALKAVAHAQKRWIRLKANHSLNGYDALSPEGTLPEPVWPELSLMEILEIALKDRFIDTLDHPILRQLRGER